MCSLLSLAVKIEFAKFLVCFPSSDGPNAAFPQRKNHTEDTADSLLPQKNGPSVLAAVVTEAQKDRIVSHRLLEFFASNVVAREVAKIRRIPIKLYRLLHEPRPLYVQCKQICKGVRALSYPTERLIQIRNQILKSSIPTEIRTNHR